MVWRAEGGGRKGETEGEETRKREKMAGKFEVDCFPFNCPLSGRWAGRISILNNWSS